MAKSRGAKLISKQYKILTPERSRKNADHSLCLADMFCNSCSLLKWMLGRQANGVTSTKERQGFCLQFIEAETVHESKQGCEWQSPEGLS